MSTPAGLKPQQALQAKIEDLWKSVSYVLDRERFDAMRQYLIEAGSHLKDGSVADGFDAYYRAKREYILARSKRQVYYWRSWRGMQVAVFLLVVLVMGVLGVFYFENRLAQPLLLLAAAAGGIGGCAAVLIQAIDVDPESEAVSKPPWYVIKPLIGTAFGLVTYLALDSGLALLSSGTRVQSDAAVVVVGFLAGFFESFSRGLLGRLAGQFTTPVVHKETADSRQSASKVEAHPPGESGETGDHTPPAA